jgi:type I restriction enzyme S subunit
VSRVADQIHTAHKDDLPSGWSVATIEGLVGKEGVFVDGDWVESKDQDPTGDVRLIQLADIGDGEYRDKSDRFLTQEKALELGCTFLNKDDVLIARMPDPLGRACIFPGDRKKSVTVVDVAIVRSGKGEFNHRWLMYFINAPAFRTSVASLQSGSTRKRISRGNLARITLPVPPREHQNRIVAEIEKQFSRLDEAVASLKRVKANLKRYKVSVLKAAVEGKLTEDWRKQHSNVEPASKLLERILAERRAKWNGRGKYKEPSVPDTASLPSLPPCWVWVSPAQLSSADTHSLAIGPFGSNLKVSDYTDSGVPLIFVRNIRSLDFGDERRVYVSTRKAAELKAHGVSGGDVLVTKMGAPPGDACLYPEQAPDAIITADCIKLRLSRMLPEKRFIVHAINAEVVKSQVLAITKGVAQMKVSLARFGGIGIPLPTLAEQQQIVAEVERRLSVIHELESAAQANLTRADRLRQSILQQAFSGRLLS